MLFFKKRKLCFERMVLHYFQHLYIYTWIHIWIHIYTVIHTVQVNIQYFLYSSFEVRCGSRFPLLIKIQNHSILLLLVYSSILAISQEPIFLPNFYLTIDSFPIYRCRRISNPVYIYRRMKFFLQIHFQLIYLSVFTSSRLKVNIPKIYLLFNFKCLSLFINVTCFSLFINVSCVFLYL